MTAVVNDPEDPRTWDADTLVRVITAALGEGDMEGVEAGLVLLALEDPHRAQEVVDTMQLGLVLARMRDKAAS